MKTLEGKLVAITGAASGIGRALAEACAASGAKLALVDVDEDGLARTAENARLSGRGRAVDTQRLDVADRAAIYAWAARIESELGGADALINNAGVSLSHRIEKMSDEDFEWLFNINFWGVANGCKAFLPQLLRKPEAHIVNLSSVFGIIGVPTQAAYNAAKFAVRGYTESLRQELRKTGVRVTCVHPGGINTNIARRGRHYEDATGQPTNTERAAAEFARAARTSPEQAARTIVGAILEDKPRLLIGADAYLIDALARLFPSSYDWVVWQVARATSRRAKT
jgi:NAD(P)-dependent dehydrogenase (short-subunit alcohol dehydrogenase family)